MAGIVNEHKEFKVLKHPVLIKRPLKFIDYFNIFCIIKLNLKFKQVRLGFFGPLQVTIKKHVMYLMVWDGAAPTIKKSPSIS